MVSIIRLIDALNEHVGRGIAWCTVAMVVIQFWVVIMRYVFALGSIPVQESIWYLHGIVFMMGAGYTLRASLDTITADQPPIFSTSLSTAARSESCKAASCSRVTNFSLPPARLHRGKRFERPVL